jgi:hypothetical protein
MRRVEEYDGVQHVGDGQRPPAGGRYLQSRLTAMSYLFWVEALGI